jgi:hypothetical protein
MIDPHAHGIASHRLGVLGLQQFRDDLHVGHAGIEPEVVTIWMKDHWDSVVDAGGHGIRRGGQNRARFDPWPSVFFQPSHSPANAKISPSFTSKQYGCFDVPFLFHS